MVSEDTHSPPTTSIEGEQTTSGNAGTRESRLERRSVLKLLGVSAIPFAAGTGSAASGDGYGAGGYGAGAYGGTDDADEPGAPLENTILFDGVGTSGETRYEFTVTGDVERSTHRGASRNEDDSIDGGTVTGSVTSWRDAFRFSGDLEELVVDGQARVSVNGERVDPSEYGGESSREVTIVGNGTHSVYELETDGSIEVSEGGDAISVSGGRAEGTIERDVHRLRLSGELVDFTFHEGGTQVYLDDQRIDPADYGSDDGTLPHAIVFDGTDAARTSSYSFTVDGDVTRSEYRGATIDGSAEIDGDAVTGTVEAGDVDAYRFDGAIDDFRLSGDADVDVEYDAR